MPIEVSSRWGMATPGAIGVVILKGWARVEAAVVRFTTRAANALPVEIWRNDSRAPRKIPRLTDIVPRKAWQQLACSSPRRVERTIFRGALHGCDPSVISSPHRNAMAEAEGTSPAAGADGEVKQAGAAAGKANSNQGWSLAINGR